MPGVNLVPAERDLLPLDFRVAVHHADRTNPLGADHFTRRFRGDDFRRRFELLVENFDQVLFGRDKRVVPVGGLGQLLHQVLVIAVSQSQGRDGDPVAADFLTQFFQIGRFARSDVRHPVA